MIVSHEIDPNTFRSPECVHTEGGVVGKLCEGTCPGCLNLRGKYHRNE